MPLRRSRRRMYAHQVVVLVTGAALDRIQSVPIGSAPDLHRMLMPVISLARKVSGRVTVHAARMAQYRHDVLESSSRLSIAHRHIPRGLGGLSGLRGDIEWGHTGKQAVCRVSQDNVSRAHFMPCRCRGLLPEAQRSLARE